MATALFRVNGKDRLSWSHKTYGEYLAANYVNIHNLSVKQTLQLLTHTTDENRVVEQLYEVTAWLASMKKEILKLVSDINPEVLLQSDTAIWSNSDKATLVDKLLIAFESGKLFNTAIKRNLYAKLYHPDIANQLKIIICDENKEWTLRREAIDIAEGCNVTELANTIVEIALDVSQEYYLRTAAARTISIIGNEKSKRKMQPFLYPNDDDIDDELKGSALSSLWPEYITTEQMLDSLTPRKKDNLIGSYQWFISRLDFSSDKKELLQALHWADKHPEHANGSDELYKLYEKILEAALHNLNDSDILRKTANVVFSIISSYHLHLIRKKDLSDISRRRIIESIVLYHEKDCLKSHIPLHVLIRPEDFDWILVNIKGKGSDIIWADLLLKTFSKDNAMEIDKILKLSESNSSIKKSIF